MIIITEDFDQSLKTLKDALELKKDIGDDTDDEGKKALSLLHFNLGSLLLEYRNKLSSTTGKEVAESIENFTKAKELLVAIGYKSDHPEVQGIGKLVYIFLCLVYLFLHIYTIVKCIPIRIMCYAVFYILC